MQYRTDPEMHRSSREKDGEGWESWDGVNVSQLGIWDQGSDAPALPLEPSRNGDAWVAKGKNVPTFCPANPQSREPTGPQLGRPTASQQGPEVCQRLIGCVCHRQGVKASTQTKHRFPVSDPSIR